jgi:hypothetical protein
MDELEKADKRIAKKKSVIDALKKKSKNKGQSPKWVMFF